MPLTDDCYLFKISSPYQYQADNLVASTIVEIIADMLTIIHCLQITGQRECFIFTATCKYPT